MNITNDTLKSRLLTAEKAARLPKWAARLIRFYQEATAELLKERDSLRRQLEGEGEIAPGSFSYYFTSGSQRVPLASNKHGVYARLSRGDIQIYIDHNDRLVVTGLGHDNIVIKPRYSNSVIINFDAEEFGARS